MGSDSQDQDSWENPYPEGTLSHDMEEFNHAWSLAVAPIVEAFEQWLIAFLQWVTRMIEVFNDWWETR